MSSPSYAFLFPGQGSQYVGMGKDLYTNFPEAKNVFDEIDDILRFPLRQLMFEGPIETLSLTQYTQPALMAVSMAVIRVIEHKTKQPFSRYCHIACGHSLGEYSALCAASSFSLTDTALLLKTRGQAMQEAVPAGKGGMVALLGATPECAASLAEEASSEGLCHIANDNGAGQIVLSGEVAALEKLLSIAVEGGAKRAIRLPVSAPFHSPLMKPAASVMKKALESISIQPPSVPVISNVTAAYFANVSEIRTGLVAQIMGKVRWRETMLLLKEKNVTHVIEAGAGKVLSTLTKRIDDSFAISSLQDAEDIHQFLEKCIF